MHKALIHSSIIFLLMIFIQPSRADEAWLLKLDGSVSPASANFIIENIEKAAEQDAKLIIIQMNTPGGLDLAMRDIIKAILSSPVPVVTYVYPNGSRAASAGTYILYASHIAAMAPATNLGAATPVSIGTPQPAKTDPSNKDPNQGNNSDAMQKKVVNDAAAYLRSLAELRNRNIDWVEKAVTKGESLTAQEAFDNGVIDLITDNFSDLLSDIDGKAVQLNSGQHILNTKDLTIKAIESDWQTKLLTVIADPNIAYILLLLGVYGLIFEAYNPGGLVPGIAGAISLLLAMYAFQILPINYAAVGLLALGIILFVAEAFAPSFGALGIGGFIAFIIGSFLLFDKAETGLAIALPLLFSVSIISFLLLTFVLGMAIRARRAPVVSGREDLVGKTAYVLNDFTGTGQVHIHGENWQANSNSSFKAGEEVTVTQVKNLTLLVNKKE